MPRAQLPSLNTTWSGIVIRSKTYYADCSHQKYYKEPPESVVCLMKAVSHRIRNPRTYVMLAALKAERRLDVTYVRKPRNDALLCPRVHCANWEGLGSSGTIDVHDPCAELQNPLKWCNRLLARLAVSRHRCHVIFLCPDYLAHYGHPSTPCELHGYLRDREPLNLRVNGQSTRHPVQYILRFLPEVKDMSCLGWQISSRSPSATVNSKISPSIHTSGNPVVVHCPGSERSLRGRARNRAAELLNMSIPFWHVETVCSRPLTFCKPR